MRLSAWARSVASRSLATALPHVLPSRRSVLAKRDRRALSTLAIDHAEAGSMVSATWLSSHWRSFVTIERWINVSPRHWNRRCANGVRGAERYVPPGGAAGPDVLGVVRAWVLRGA